MRFKSNPMCSESHPPSQKSVDERLNPPDIIGSRNLPSGPDTLHTAICSAFTEYLIKKVIPASDIRIKPYIEDECRVTVATKHALPDIDTAAAPRLFGMPIFGYRYDSAEPTAGCVYTTFEVEPAFIVAAARVLAPRLPAAPETFKTVINDMEYAVFRARLLAEIGSVDPVNGVEIEPNIWINALWLAFYALEPDPRLFISDNIIARHAAEVATKATRPTIRKSQNPLFNWREYGDWIARLLCHWSNQLDKKREEDRNGYNLAGTFNL